MTAEEQIKEVMELARLVSGNSWEQGDAIGNDFPPNETCVHAAAEATKAIEAKLRNLIKDEA